MRQTERNNISTRLKARSCRSGGDAHHRVQQQRRGTAAPSASKAAPAATGAPGGVRPAPPPRSQVTLLTKAWRFLGCHDRGAKQYETDHPDDIELTTNACKTNDDTPCQIAQIQDAVTKGAQAIVISPMGVGVTDALNEAQQAGVRIVFVDNTIPGVVPDAVAATNNVKGGEAAGAYIKSQLKSGDIIGLLEAVRGVPNLDQRIDGSRQRSKNWRRGRDRGSADPV